MSDDEKIEESPKGRKTESPLQQPGVLSQEPRVEPVILAESEIKAMEVHHHPQLAHKPKPWKEYLLEYIMIVLAVTTGFFAENFRESITEHHIEKEYIISLNEDMHENDSVLTSMIKAHQQNVIMMDSLINLLGQLNPIKGGEGALYYFSRIAPRVEILSLTDRTFQQLKNSGNAHVITDLNTIGQVIKY